ncbi:hypothetical protein DIPPA_08839 [Diplonema papillatum]|nr:hypothetical protein DIPPA_08839 [Diplonema papillatum]
MAGRAVPVVIVFCLVALGLIILLWFCMRRLRQPPAERGREARCSEMLLPGAPCFTGEAGDVYRVSYLLLNAANTGNVDIDYPKWEPNTDRSEILAAYRLAHLTVGITGRGRAQIANASSGKTIRDERETEGIYREYLQRVVCAYASSTKRCLDTAGELLKIGPAYTKTEKIAPRCPGRIVPVETLSQYGALIEDNDGKLAAGKIPKDYMQVEDAIAAVGTTECDLQALYAERPPTYEKSTRSALRTYISSAAFFVTKDLLTDNRSALHQAKSDDQDDVVLIVGQSPYINALAVHLADLMGHSVSKRRELEEVNLGDLDGFYVTRDPKQTKALDFDDQDAAVAEYLALHETGDNFAPTIVAATTRGLGAKKVSVAPY